MRYMNKRFISLLTYLYYCNRNAE